MDSFKIIGDLPETSRRTQDRNLPVKRMASEENLSVARFINEPDTDFSLPHNSLWADKIVRTWSLLDEGSGAKIPCVIDGVEIFREKKKMSCFDPSMPEVRIGNYVQTSESNISKAVHCAKRDSEGWRHMHPEDRSIILKNVAFEVQNISGLLLLSDSF